MKIPTDEQETVIQFDRSASTATVDTSDVTVMNKLDKLVERSDKWTVIKEHYSQEHELIGKCYQTQKGLISFRSDKVKKELTDEQRQAIADRLKESRAKHNS